MKRILFILMVFFAMSASISVFSQEKKEVIMQTDSIISPQMNVINNRLHVKNAPVGKRIEIVSILGNKVKEIEIKSPDGEYELNLPKAIYIFKLEGTVRKFVIK